MEQMIKDGADIFVVGSGIYNEKDPRQTIRSMRELARKFEKP
jgi:3-keto-L-gulonate-6-phosphate decarboxylase